MKKNSISVLIIMVLAILVAGCGGSGSGSGNNSSTGVVSHFHAQYTNGAPFPAVTIYYADPANSLHVIKTNSSGDVSFITTQPGRYIVTSFQYLNVTSPVITGGISFNYTQANISDGSQYYYVITIDTETGGIVLKQQK